MMNGINFEAIVSEFSPSTQTIYTNVWRRWLNWCKENEIAPTPITQAIFDRFVAEMRANNRSGQYVRHFLSVLRRVNEAIGYVEEPLALDDSQVVKLRPPYVLLNSAMMPAPGVYHLVEMTQSDWAKALQRAASQQAIHSYIGYPDTAKHVQEITGLPVEVNRAETVLGDSATLFIVKLRYRVSDPSQKGQFTPDSADYVYYVAKYTRN